MLTRRSVWTSFPTHIPILMIHRPKELEIFMDLLLPFIVFSRFLLRILESIPWLSLLKRELSYSTLLNEIFNYDVYKIAFMSPSMNKNASFCINIMHLIVSTPKFHTNSLFQKWPNVRFASQLAYTTLGKISRKWRIFSNKRISCSKKRWQPCRLR